jgi:hypothetical protein
VTETLATTELGTYGTCIADGPALVSSAAVGHLLRSKTADSKETVPPPFSSSPPRPGPTRWFKRHASNAPPPPECR